MTINVLNEWDDKRAGLMWPPVGSARMGINWQGKIGNQLAGRDLRLISKGIVTTNWLERSRDQVAG